MAGSVGGYDAGTAWLKVVPSFEHIDRAIANNVKRLAKQVDQGLTQAIAPSMRRALNDPNLLRSGQTAGGRIGDAVADATVRRLDRALRALPAAHVGVARNAAEQAVRDLRSELEQLRHLRLEFSIDDAALLSVLRRARQQLRDLDASAGPDRGRLRLAGAELDDTVEGLLAGLQRAGGALQQSIRRAVTGALSALPEVPLKVNNVEVVQKLAQVRAELEALRDARVGVDVDAGAAMTRLAAVKALLESIDGDDVDIQVKVDTERAASELGQVTGLGDEVAEVGTAAASTLGRLGAMIAAGLSLGTALVPAAAAGAAAVGAIGTAAFAAAAGLGVLALGVSGVFGAVTALDRYQNDADKSAKSLAAAQNQVANATDQVASAQRSLANTRASTAFAARRAARTVVEAERSVTEAHRDTLEAQVALTRAVRDAQRADEDRALQLADNALAQRQAALDLEEARAERDRLVRNRRVTAAEREQAEITFEQRLLQIRRLSAEGSRLQAEQEEANRVGIAGSEQVVAAQDRIRVAAQREADARQRVTDAVEAQREQQRQAAHQIAQGEQAVVAAQRSMQQATVNASVAGGEALDNLREKMAQLSPEGRKFALFIFSLKDEALSLRAAAEAGLLPGLQEAIEELLPYFPALRRFVGEVADGLGDLAVEGVRALDDPVWRKFFGLMADQAVPALKGMFQWGLLVARGIAAVVDSLAPFNRPIGQGLLGYAEAFSEWAAALDTNAGYQDFLDYVRRVGPKVIDLLEGLVKFTAHFVIAAAPIGELVVDAFGALMDVLNAIPTPLLTLLIGLIGAYTLALLANAGVMRLSNNNSALATNLSILKARSMTALTGVMTRYTVATGGAATATGVLSAALARATGAAATARAGLASFVSFLGGPWTTALIAATVVLTSHLQHQADVGARADDMGSALDQVADAYQSGGDTAVQALARQNRSVGKAVQELARYGITAKEVFGAQNGDVQLQAKVIEALERRLAEMNRQFGEFKDNQGWLDFLGGAENPVDFKDIEALKRHIDELRRKWLIAKEAADAATGGEFAANVRDATAAARGFTSEQAELVDAFARIGDATASAASRADAFRRAYELLFGSVQKQTEATEDYHRALLDLDEGLATSGKSLEVNTREGLDNRAALRQVIQASVEMAATDIERGETLDVVTRKHNERITALQKEVTDLGLNEKAVKDMIVQYGQLPTDVQTNFTQTGVEVVKTAFREILADVEYLLRYGYLPARSQGDEIRRPGRLGSRGPFAEGGYVQGPGTSTSDSIPAWLSNEEYVHRAKAVRYYGVDIMDAINKMRIPRQAVQGFAGGGLVRPRRQRPGALPLQRPPLQDGPELAGQLGIDFATISTEVIRKRVIDEALRRAEAGVGELGTMAGGVGWRWQMEVLRKQFAALPLYSGYRANSYTASGGLSWHSRDGGRAVDLPPRADVFRFIHDTYGAATKELIWLGDAYHNIKNGRYHKYSDELLAQHGTAGMPNAHIHWAFDEGGYLPPGWSPPIWNGTGKPEAVMTHSQWSTIRQAVEQGQYAGPGTVNNFTFANTTLTAGKFQAIQDRQAALNRSGRAR